MDDLIRRREALQMYKSPIEVIQSDIQMKTEECILKAVQKIGVNIDKDELIKAIMYDRKQYENGYADGIAAAQRWIQCGERMPDIKEHHVSEPCIVYCSNGAYAFAELQENIFGQVGWDCERDDEYHEAVGEVVAWMPLPEPYQAAEGESDDD